MAIRRAEFCFCAVWTNASIRSNGDGIFYFETNGWAGNNLNAGARVDAIRILRYGTTRGCDGFVRHRSGWKRSSDA